VLPPGDSIPTRDAVIWRMERLPSVPKNYASGVRMPGRNFDDISTLSMRCQRSSIVLPPDDSIRDGAVVSLGLLFSFRPRTFNSVIAHHRAQCVWQVAAGVVPAPGRGASRLRGGWVAIPMGGLDHLEPRQVDRVRIPRSKPPRGRRALWALPTFFVPASCIAGRYDARSTRLICIPTYDTTLYRE
jgi:hypothetical protein